MIIFLLSVIALMLILITSVLLFCKSSVITALIIVPSILLCCLLVYIIILLLSKWLSYLWQGSDDETFGWRGIKEVFGSDDGEGLIISIGLKCIWECFMPFVLSIIGFGLPIELCSIFFIKILVFVGIIPHGFWGTRF